MDVVQTTKEKAWEKASCIAGQDPDDTRQDMEGMWMCREMCNIAGLGGWAVDIHGNAIAYQLSGKPVMGDDLVSSQATTWYLPSICHEKEIDYTRGRSALCRTGRLTEPGSGRHSGGDVRPEAAYACREATLKMPRLRRQTSETASLSVAGELVFNIFGAIAPFERYLNAERTRDSITAARKPGRNPGRPPASERLLQRRNNLYSARA